MTLTQRTRSVALIILGIILIVLTYKIYESGEQEAYIQKHSPSVKMPVVRRVKGWGTVRYPNKIYVRYKGKKYVLISSNRHFRQTANEDSLLVNFDRKADQAVLPDLKTTSPYFLLIVMAVLGFASMYYAIVDLRRSM